MSFESVRIDIHIWKHLKKYNEQDATFLKRFDGEAYYISKTERLGIVLLGLLDPQPKNFIPRNSSNPLPTITFDLGRHTETKIRSYLSDENEERFNKYLHKDFKRDAVMHIRILNGFGVSAEKALMHFYTHHHLLEEDLNPESLLKEFKRDKVLLQSRISIELPRIFPKLSLKTAHG